MEIKSVLRNPYALEFLAELGGAQSIDIVGLLAKNGELDEFKLSELLTHDIKAVRKILYRLHNEKIVSFKRKKDQETGWTVYIWKLELKKLRILLEKKKVDALIDLEEKLIFEKENQFFRCVNGCSRLPFDKAFELEFKCHECGKQLNFIDNSKIVMQLERYVSRMRVAG
jgi:transcription initiation factor TFIIE subunit alpha